MIQPIKIELELEPANARALIAGLPGMQKQVETKISANPDAMQAVGLECLRRGLGEVFAALQTAAKK